ncbi:Pentatricopeptide repeat-containing protein [Thalictrum thalictroides]|uniref:Pentatricopeptide repeat-containing protein n=1 Tax=Thalictrum thalictroides TaxID=46969 RepID=A0A7J6VCP2_THATH|nr:Pentatricopeptide repeat-containing protein [Thalictrum thalictroides]
MTGYLSQSNAMESLPLFCKMGYSGIKPNEFTFSTILKAFTIVGVPENGTQVHLICAKTGFESMPVVGNSLIDKYSKFGKVLEAICLFDRMPFKNLISWNVMIAVCVSEAQQIFNLIVRKNVICWTAIIVGCRQEGHIHDAMDLFKQLRKTEIQVDSFILSIMISIFADFSLVEQGKQMHSYTIKVSSGLDLSVANSLIDVYKCGLTEEAKRCFHEISNPSMVSWTVMITEYGKHGYGSDAIHLFEQMQLENIDPDDVTYLAVLSACSHAGMTEEGCKYFSRLCDDRKIRPKVEHYACMVDLLGRAGRLEEAKNLIENIPVKTKCRDMADITRGL